MGTRETSLIGLNLSTYKTGSKSILNHAGITRGIVTIFYVMSELMVYE